MPQKVLWFALGALALVLACASGDGETSAGSAGATAAGATAASPGASGAQSNQAVGSKPAIEEVKITECTRESDSLGFAIAKGTVTNSTSKASNYSINLAFESEDGKTQLATTVEFVSSLAPGQTAPFDASALKKIDQPFRCRVTEVTRFAS